MVSKNQIKLITSLQQKKYRSAHQLFFAEGLKGIAELLHSEFELDHIYCTEPLFTEIPESKRTLITHPDLKKMSALSAANNCLALFKIPVSKPVISSGLILALDDIRDPGNLGTILRLCDWFGVEQVICSHETVDVFNPKVVQATMGSLSRVAVHYTDLKEYLTKTTLPVFGTFMDGKNIYAETLPCEGIIVMGNEANGISETIKKTFIRKIAIPRFGSLQQTESLNVASATAIILSEFRRKDSRQTDG